MNKRSIAFLLMLTWTISSGISHAWTEGLPVVTNFRLESNESTQKQAPILLLVMSNTCFYCERVLREFLLPMQRNPEYADKAILRQIEIASKNKLTDFNGKVTTQAAYAKARKVLAVPTILLLDDKGNELARITGLGNADFYQTYLDNALEESGEKIKGRNK